MDDDDDDGCFVLPGSVCGTGLDTLSLLPGERPVLLAPDVLVDDDVRGSLFLTSYRLLYPAAGAIKSLPLMSILKVERHAEWIDVSCRDVRQLRIRRPGCFGNGADADVGMEDLATQLRTAAMPRSIDDLYARSCGVERQSKHAAFNIMTEYARWGLGLDLSRLNPAALKWRISSSNAQHQVCGTYPSHLVVPAGIHDTALRRIASYRSNGRLPVTTWMSLSPEGDTSVALLRSGQPLVGIMNSRCSEEELLVREARAASGRPRFHIFDARSYTIALTNKAAGGGFENVENHYVDCELSFLSLPNMHSIRESHEALMRACRTNTEDSKWHSILESTKWTLYLSSLLSASRLIATKLANERISSLVHCTDGWDRTAQLVSLAQLLIDPYYRTINGFIALIEKDWLHFGHQFGRRYGQPTSSGRGCSSPMEQAPIFTQFLHAVYVLLRQTPAAFEFGSGMLLELARHVCSCRFATFLGNGEGERARMGARGPSLWDHIAANRRSIVNSLYIEPTAGGVQTLLGSLQTAPRLIAFWDEYFIALPDEAIGAPVVTLPSPADSARQAAILRRAESMRLRVKERRRLILMSQAFRALRDNSQRRQLKRAEGTLIARDILNEVLDGVLDQIALDGTGWQPIDDQSLSSDEAEWASEVLQDEGEDQVKDVDESSPTIDLVLSAQASCDRMQGISEEFVIV